MQEKQQPHHQASQAGTRRQEPIRQTATKITKLVYFAIARCGNNSRGHEKERPVRLIWIVVVRDMQPVITVEPVPQTTTSRKYLLLLMATSSPFSILEVTRHCIGRISRLPMCQVISSVNSLGDARASRQCHPRCLSGNWPPTKAQQPLQSCRRRPHVCPVVLLPRSVSSMLGPT
jgi:hypothetical protein